MVTPFSMSSKASAQSQVGLLKKGEKRDTSDDGDGDNRDNLIKQGQHQPPSLSCSL